MKRKISPEGVLERDFESPRPSVKVALNRWFKSRATVAVVDDLVVGLLAESKGTPCSWIDQLYLLPGWVGRGIGTRLLELGRTELLPPIRLYTFQCNQPARYFYERRGFKAIVFGDGAGNEGKCPDILYEWQPGR